MFNPNEISSDLLRSVINSYTKENLQVIESILGRYWLGLDEKLQRTIRKFIDEEPENWEYLINFLSKCEKAEINK